MVEPGEDIDDLTTMTVIEMSDSENAFSNKPTDLLRPWHRLLVQQHVDRSVRHFRPT